MSIALSSARRSTSSVASVRAKRATATSRISLPKSGTLSTNVSQRSRPAGVFFQRRKQ